MCSKQFWWQWRCQFWLATSLPSKLATSLPILMATTLPIVCTNVEIIAWPHLPGNICTVIKATRFSSFSKQKNQNMFCFLFCFGFEFSSHLIIYFWKSEQTIQIKTNQKHFVFQQIKTIKNILNPGTD